jgi:glycosyltransferase involved in cell wall biosynthesis
MTDQIDVTILMPCLNEAETLSTCIRKAHIGCQNAGITYEILVADNGSTDGSPEIARAAGADVIEVPIRGYGAALRAGIQAARGNFIIMGDADDSYDFSEISLFIEKWRKGYELVMGSRLRGEIKPGAMPFLHRWLGNPLLTSLGNLFFWNELSDYHCGLRGFEKQAILDLDLRTNGMEFASEMVIKAVLAGLKITEVPIVLWPDGRSRQPHLRTWRDGWRHLRFMLLYSPNWLFIIPGLTLFGLGLMILLVLVGGPLDIGKLHFDIHYMVLGSLLALIGFQVITLGLYAKVYAISEHFEEKSRTLNLIFKYFNLERGILLGSLIFIGGLSINLYILFVWLIGDFAFGGQPRLREAILAMTLMVIGLQTVFSSFFLSLLGIPLKSTKV